MNLIERNIGKLKASAPQYHTVKRYDTDNLLKWVLDCLNGMAWKDDCQVVELYGKKEYSDNPRTEIKIGEVFTVARFQAILSPMNMQNESKRY